MRVLVTGAARPGRPRGRRTARRTRRTTNVLALRQFRAGYFGPRARAPGVRGVGARPDHQRRRVHRRRRLRERTGQGLCRQRPRAAPLGRRGAPGRRPPGPYFDRLCLRRHVAVALCRMGPHSTPCRSTAGPNWRANTRCCPVLPGAAVVRSSWVCGRYGANMVKTILRLAAATGPLRFVDDQTGCPTFADDLAAMLVRLAVARLPGTFHVTNQGATTWYGFARDVLAAAGHDPDRVEPIQDGRPGPASAGPPAGQFGARQRRTAPARASPCLADYHEPLERTVKYLLPSRSVDVSDDVCRRCRQLQRQDTCSPCVASLLDEGVSLVVVADNGSTDGSELALLGALPGGQMGANGGQPRLRDGRQPRGGPGRQHVHPGLQRRRGAWAEAQRGASCAAPREQARRGRGRAPHPRRRRRPLPLGAALPRPARGLRARDPRPVLGRATRFPGATGCRLGPRRAPRRWTGSRAPASWPGGRPGRPWAASTALTSCTWRTSTSAGASAGPVGPSPMSRRPRSSTSRACRPTATPTGCCFAHHVSMWRFARRTTPAGRRWVLPLVLPGLAVRLGLTRRSGGPRAGLASAALAGRPLPVRAER